MRDFVGRIAKGAIGHTVFGLGLHRMLLKGKATVVAFHTIGEHGSKNSIQVSPDLFRSYCQFFRTYFDVVSLSELIDDLRENRDVGGKLAITFDDGYRDNYEFAAPELERTRLPATFFITTNFIDSQTIPWWDKQSNINSEWMTWDNIIDLDSRGFEIGAHTISHANMQVSSEEEAREEILGSKQVIEEKLGHPISHFAYPYGGREHITETARKIVGEAGFESCVSCFGGVVSVESSPMDLPRTPINDWYRSPYEFGLDVVRSYREASGEYPHLADDKKNILVVSYHLYPDSSVGAKRPSELLKFIADNGHDATGMGASVGARAARDLDLGSRLDGLRVLRAPQPPSVLDWVWKNLKAARRSLLPANSDSKLIAGTERGNAESANNESIRDWARRNYNALYSLFGARKTWAFLSMIRLVVDRFRNRYDIVISSGPPSAAHIVGRFAASLHQCRYVLDFRDPWVGNTHASAAGNSKIRERLEKAFEKNCFTRSDAVVVTTPGIQRMLNDRYPGQTDKVHIIYNGYDGELKMPPAEPPGRLDMLYAGTLYLNRNPFPLLEAIKALVEMQDVDRSKVSMTFVGSCDKWNGVSLHEWIKSNGCEDIVAIQDRVSAKEIEALSDQSTVLVNLAQGQPDQIPAKTFDYLASGKTMLVVTEPGSSTYDVVDSVDNVIVMETEECTAKNCRRLRRVYDQMIAGSTAQRSAQDVIAIFSRSHQNRKLLRKLNVVAR